MIPGLLKQESFGSYAEFVRDYQVNVDDTFNFTYDVVDYWAKTEPEKRALLWLNDYGETREFTFTEISRLSKKAANWLCGQGIEKGDRVMLLLGRRWEYWITAVALHRLGAVLIPAANQLSAKDIAYRVKSANVKMLIVENLDYIAGQAELAARETPVKLAIAASKRAGWLDYNAGIEAASERFDRRPLSSSDLMMIYFTSGTTGMPKMVAHDHTYPLGHIVTAKYWHMVQENGLHLTVSDSGWAKFGWGCIYGQWICGSAVLGYDMERFNPKNLIRVIAECKPNTVCVPPTIYRFMMKNGLTGADFASVKHCSTAGEPLAPEVQERFFELTGLRIHEGFGQSESSVMLANYGWFLPRPGSMGKPSPLYGIAAVRPDGTTCAIGETGELVVRGLDKARVPGLFRGYFTEEGTLRCPYEDGVYHLGDMVYYDEDGYYWFVGRNDDMIKCSGYRIGPFEIESVLLAHPAVLECAITGAPDPIRGQVVKASIVLGPGYLGSEELTKELQEHVKHNTAPYKYPRIVEYVCELPKTTSGKISRAQIRGKE